MKSLSARVPRVFRSRYSPKVFYIFASSLIGKESCAYLRMFSNYIAVIGTGLLRSTACLSVPRVENALEVEQIAPIFSPFQRHEEAILRRDDGSCSKGMHPCM